MTIMATRRIDLAKSHVCIHTRVEGLMCRLAHDLELRAENFEGQVHLETDEDAWSATLRFPVDGLRVGGVLRGERVDEGVLSERDLRQIHDKIQKEVLLGPEVLVRVNGKVRSSGQGIVRAPRDQHRIRFDLSHSTDGGLVSGCLDLSLEKLGIAPVRGPLGAFRVADTVVVKFGLAWR